MQNEKYICKKQIIQEFGISKATFYRILKQLDITVSGKMLSPREAEGLREALRNKITISSSSQDNISS